MGVVFHCGRGHSDSGMMSRVDVCGARIDLLVCERGVTRHASMPIGGLCEVVDCSLWNQ